MDTTETKRRETFLGFQPPAIGEEEIAAVTETLRSGWLTTGPAAAELERRFAEYLDVKHALAVTSGTAAMHLALAALGVGPGDEVVTTPITWPATANVIVHVGATPVFADVRADDLNIDPEHAARSWARGRRRSCQCTSRASRPTSTRSGRSASRSSRTPRTPSRAPTGTKDRRSLRGDLLLALRDEERRRGRGRDHRHEPRRRRRRRGRPPVMRRGHGSRYDIPVPGYKANLSDVLASIALCQLDKIERHRRSASAMSPPTTRRSPSSTASTRSGGPARHPRAPPLHRPHRPGAGRGVAGRVPAGSRRGADRDEHPLPARAPADRVPRALPRADATPGRREGGDEVLSPPLSAAHSDADIEDAIDALRRVHVRFAGSSS